MRPYLTWKDFDVLGPQNELLTFTDLKLVVFQADFGGIVFREDLHSEMGVRFRIKLCPKIASGFES